jgi:hypothetical protein
MSEKEINDSNAIENKISHMLSKILKEDSDDEVDGVADFETMDNDSGRPTHYDFFPRKEKKTQSEKPRHTPVCFGEGIPTICDDSNYEQLYIQQKELLHRHKKFKTTNVTTTSPQIVINKFNTIYNVGGMAQGYNSGVPLNYVRNTIKHQTGVQKPNLVELLRYQKNLFTINDFQGEGLLTDKLERIDQNTFDLLRGNFGGLIRNQNTGRILQNALQQSDKSVLSGILLEILPEFHNLIIDSYGNYFCQKFYHYVSFEDKLMILRQLRKYLIQISNSEIGTYPLQSIIERLHYPEEKMVFVEAISDPRVLKEICSDQFGVHVIEKMIVCFNEELIPFVYEYVISNFMAIANTSTGLVITKKAISHARQVVTVKRLQVLIVSNFNVLIQNAYGNYTIQVALEVNITINT